MENCHEIHEPQIIVKSVFNRCSIRGFLSHWVAVEILSLPLSPGECLTSNLRRPPKTITRMPIILWVANHQFAGEAELVPTGRIMPSLPDIPVVTVAPAPMNIQVVTVSTGDRTPLARNNRFRPDFRLIQGETCHGPQNDPRNSFVPVHSGNGVRGEQLDGAGRGDGPAVRLGTFLLLPVRVLPAQLQRPRAVRQLVLPISAGTTDSGLQHRMAQFLSEPSSLLSRAPFHPGCVLRRLPRHPDQFRNPVSQ